MTPGAGYCSRNGSPNVLAAAYQIVVPQIILTFFESSWLPLAWNTCQDSGEAVGHGLGDELTWHRGRPCDTGTCVEIAVADGEVLVRSSVHPARLISLSRDEWREFLAGAKEGWFDHM